MDADPSVEESESVQTAEQRDLIVKGRSIEYFLKRAWLPNAPLLVIFHGYGYQENPARFTDPNYNIICPMDRFGHENSGSWYLGESGDFFWFEAISQIISQVRKEMGKGPLYCWGSSMGGYAALLHGYLNDAKGIYANVAQTCLYNSTYAENHMVQFDSIFNGRVTSWNSLPDVINKKKKTFYYLTYAGLASRNYVQEHCLPLIEKFQLLRQPFFLELLPTAQHKALYSVAASLRKLLSCCEGKGK